MTDTSRAHRPALWATLCLAVVFLAGCGSSDPTDATASAQEPETMSMTEELPDIDPADYAGVRSVEARRIDFDSPVSEVEARAWAEAAGFEAIEVERGGRRELSYSYASITLQPNDAGEIVGAVVG